MSALQASTRWSRPAGVALLAAAVALPAVASNYLIDVGLTITIYSILGLGLNIVVGYAGLLDLGYAAFFAIGAYTTALLETLLHFSFWETLPFSLAFAGASGIVIGYPTLRLRSDYLSIVTLGFGEITRIAATNLDITGGPNGIYGIASPSLFGYEISSPRAVYELGIAFLVLVLALAIRLGQSRLGRAWTSIREDEAAAEAVGVPTLLVKMLAYVMGALIGGSAGSLFAARFGTIDPTGFTYLQSVTILIEVPAQYASSQSLPNEDGHWPSTDWASQFGDPQLPQLIDEALQGNPSIAQAEARIAKVSSYIESSKSTLYPKANGSYSGIRELYSENTIFPPPFGGTWYSENNVLASASWELDLWGKNRARLGQAVSQEKAAEADLQQVRVTLATSVANSYNQLARLYELRDIAIREIRDRVDISRITNGRVVAGLDTNVERQTALGDIATSQTNLRDLDGQIIVVRHQLAALLGNGPDRGLQITKPVLTPGTTVTLPSNLPADLVSRRPDIVVARWQAEAVMHDVTEAKAEFFPDVNLAAGFGFDAFGWGRFLTRSSRQIQFGPAVHLPLFDAGALRSQLKGRYADFDLDVANYNQTLINALSDAATHIATIHSIDQQSADAQQALAAQTKAYELAVIRYKAGLSEQLQVLNADQNRLAAEQTVTNLRMTRRATQIGLIKALGGGFDAKRESLVVPTDVPSSSTSATQAAN
ncbi:efflux transporter outer membrane subunit [Paraburkholderia sediminicola]|uniref:efflux transporter outer membrane subunit n=1 Tax=Paraburkholderia sediminicola TaxID=458836 RepID=UPI0038B6F1E1